MNLLARSRVSLDSVHEALLQREFWRCGDVMDYYG